MSGRRKSAQEILETKQISVATERRSPPLVASLERKRLRAYLALLLADVVTILASGLAAGLLYEGLFPHPTALLQAQLLLPLYLTIGLYNATYSLPALSDTRFAIGKSLMALLISTGLLGFVLFYAKTGPIFSRGASTLAVIIAALSLTVTRLVARAIVSRRWCGRVANILVIRDGGSEFALPGALMVDAETAGLDPNSHNPRSLDSLGQYLRNQDKVIVSRRRGRRKAWAFVLKAAGVTGEVLSTSADAVGAVGVAHYAGTGRSALVVAMGPLGLRARAMKRIFDLAIAVTTLIVLAPLLVSIALAVKLGDGGTPLFLQSRVGKGNRIFGMWKFRTMRECCADPRGELSTVSDDRRVTMIGRLLRRTSLDELPQLWNVLRGEMSIVGPRPHALGSQAGEKLFWEVDSRYWHRHSLKPGLTGLAQVRGLRGTTEHEGELAVRLQADLEYIARWSLLRDMTILLRTLLVLVHRRAY